MSHAKDRSGAPRGAAHEGEEVKVEVEEKDDKSPHAPFKGQNALALWQPLVASVAPWKKFEKSFQN
jgi:hypothetical protein